MIVLHTFGPAFGLPDPSPFVTKVDVLLKMSGLPFRTEASGLRGAPKGKLPYIEDDGAKIADSTFIRWHLEKRHGVDFDRGLDAAQRAAAWAFEKMAEDHLYWAAVHERWFVEENFASGPAQFFQKIPALVRPAVMAVIRRSLRRTLHGQGMGRHSRADIQALGMRSVDAIADFLGDKPFFLGPAPSGVDATMFAFAAGLLCPNFNTPLRDAAERHGNLRDYVARMAARFYPDMPGLAALAGGDLLTQIRG